jgi:glycosyltransferase involved in cell wall biosynthesis
MKIAMIGSRGVDSNYSGVEKTVRELGVRLVRKGHNIIVFSQNGQKNQNPPVSYEGIKIKRIPTLQGKHTETLIRAAISTALSCLDSFDIINLHAEGPGLFSAIARMLGKKTVVTIHGLDWKRAKWSSFASFCLKTAEKTAIKYADEIVVVSQTLQKYFKETYGRDTTFIPNAVVIYDRPESYDNLASLGLAPGEYCLFASRLVPEKGCHDLIEAFNTLDTHKKLVIAGGSRYQDDYIDGLKELANPEKIMFTGHVTGDLLKELFSYTYVFLLPSYIEGLSNALLEAISYQKCTLVSDIPENLEVIQDYGYSFRVGDKKDLADKLGMLIDDPAMVNAVEAKIKELGESKYTWDYISGEYDAVFRSLSEQNKEPLTRHLKNNLA